MDATRVIMGAISIIIGLVLVPVLGGFIFNAKANSSIASIAGLTSVIDLIAYGFVFGLVGLGVGMIVMGFRSK